MTVIAHEPAYEQLTLSVRENWLVVDGGVETLLQKEGLERLLRQLLGVQGVKSEVSVRSSLVPCPHKAGIAGEGGESFKLIIELRLEENAG